MKTLNLPFKLAPLALLMAVFLAVCFVTCAPPAPEPDPEPDPEPTTSGYASDVIKHTHKKGEDPCPQEIEAKADVYCFKGDQFTECDADSVVITVQSVGLTAKFASNGLQHETLGGGQTPEKREICFTFTCGIAQSFTHNYTLVFYKDGVKVDEETVRMEITVVE